MKEGIPSDYEMEVTTLRLAHEPLLQAVYEGADSVAREIETERKYIVPELEVESLRDSFYREAMITQRYVYPVHHDSATGKDESIRFRVRAWREAQASEEDTQYLVQLKEKTDPRRPNTKEERKIAVDAGQFKRLWQKGEWNPVTKRRAYIRHVGVSGMECTIHIDTYEKGSGSDENIVGKQVVEVEFLKGEDEENFAQQLKVLKKGGINAFEKAFPHLDTPDVPEWLWNAEDVTDRKEFKNYRIAQNGWPEE